jgi:hypothetical protein
MFKKPLAMMKKAFSFVRPKPKDQIPKRVKSQQQLHAEESHEAARKKRWNIHRRRTAYLRRRVVFWRRAKKVAYKSRRFNNLQGI